MKRQLADVSNLDVPITLVRNVMTLEGSRETILSKLPQRKEYTLRVDNNLTGSSIVTRASVRSIQVYVSSNPNSSFYVSATGGKQAVN